MNSTYKAGTSLGQIFVALVATVLIGSFTVVGTVGQAPAAAAQIAAPTLA